LKNITIAIVDSGVEILEKVKGASIIKQDNEQYYVADKMSDENGHGTIVYNIFKKNVAQAEIFNVKLFSEQDEVECDRLIFALNYLFESIHPDIIHMSLGVSFCEKIPQLRDICKKIVDSGTVIVAAFNNDGSYSYPAAFPFVVGVESSKEIQKTTDYFYLQNSPINIATIGVAQRLLGKGNKYYDVVGSSFSTPYITSFIANKLISEEVEQNFDSVIQMLQANCTKKYIAKPFNSIQLPFEIKEAVMFPYNKEIKTLARYSEQMTFLLRGIYDVKYLGNVGKNISISNNASIEIKSFDHLCWEDDFDTVILGHTKELTKITKKDYMQIVIEKCIRFHKNLYSFDEIPNDLKNSMEENGLKCFVPDITCDNVPTGNEGRMRQIAKPVICVAGTSSKQGKFSVQVKLKSMFDEVIKTGFLSTEPSGYLLGADGVFPMGFGSTIKLQSGEDYIVVANHILGMIEDKECDLIITGLQSQTIPMQLCNQVDTVLYNHYFLLGINPDAIILVVNVFDEVEYIWRTIKYLENIIICDVIALVVFPIQRTFKWNTLGDLSVRYSEEVLQETKQKLETEFKRDVLILDDDIDMKRLYEICVEYFNE